ATLSPPRPLEPLPLLGRGCGEAEDAAVGKRDLQRMGVEHHRGDPASANVPVEAGRTVAGIAGDGVAGVAAVHADLVFATGEQAGLDDRRATAVAFDDAEAGLRSLAAAAFRHRDGRPRRTAQRGGAGAQVVGPLALDEREVAPVDLMLP